jgi:monoterpene epsilon-lactone hydrolase
MSLEQLEAVKALIRQRPHFTATMAERRAAWDRLAARFKPGPDVTIEPAALGGIPGRWVSTPGASRAHVILFFHGGGFVLGSAESHQELLGRLCKAAGTRGFAVDYRLAPEHPFPAGLEDCVRAYEGLLASGVEADRVAFAGDSAGGTFVIAAMLAARARKLPLPGAGVCWSGWYDLTASSPSFEANADRDIFVPPGFAKAAPPVYLQGADPRDPLASPIFGDLRGLPHVFIQVGEPEVLLDDARWLHARLQESGGRSSLEVWPHMTHIWQFFGPMLDEGLEATERSGQFIRDTLRVIRPQ